MDTIEPTDHVSLRAALMEGRHSDEIRIQFRDLMWLRLRMMSQISGIEIPSNVFYDEFNYDLDHLINLSMAMDHWETIALEQAFTKEFGAYKDFAKRFPDYLNSTGE